VKTLLVVAALSLFPATALANHQCRMEVFETTGGRAARLVPIGPNAHCGVRARRVSSSPRSVRRLGTNALRTNQSRNQNYRQVPWDPSPNR
jgi:hypothetical protein